MGWPDSYAARNQDRDEREGNSRGQNDARVPRQLDGSATSQERGQGLAQHDKLRDSR